MRLTDEEALDAKEATADAAIVKESEERKKWMKDNDHWLRQDFIEASEEAFSAYKEAQWQEYLQND